MRRVILGLLPLLLAIGGCSGASTVRIGTRRVSFDDIYRRVHENDVKLRTLQAEGELTVETPTFSQSGTIRISMLKPDSLFVTVHGPFGIRVGSALMTPVLFRFYNSLQNKEYVGASSQENLRKLLHVDVSYDEVLSLFAGGAFLASDSLDPSASGVEDEEAQFRFDGSPYARLYSIDGESMMIRRIVLLDDSGIPVFEQTFDRFDSTGGITIPRSTRLTLPKSRRRISLYYDEILANAPLPPMRLEVPASAERVVLQ